MTRQPATRDTIAERRHREMIERLERIALGLEALHQQGDRTSRLLAEISAQVESALRYFIDLGQGLREQAGPQPRS
jgi:two-component sensor histidine kinase